jgi:hypothetical protein
MVTVSQRLEVIRVTTTKKFHLDGPLTEERFRELGRDLADQTKSELDGSLAFFERIELDGTLFSDGCAGCVFQAENGARAAALARAELSHR